jgi:hypothetical protein
MKEKNKDRAGERFCRNFEKDSTILYISMSRGTWHFLVVSVIHSGCDARREI